MNALQQYQSDGERRARAYVRDGGTPSEAVARAQQSIEVERRARPTISGLTQWAHQCVDCGTRVGNWVKKPEHDAPAWDMAAEEAAAMRRPNTRPDENAERLAKEWSWRRVYEQFIRSREWQHMRSLVMRRAKNTCEACLEHEAEQVHHTRYPSGDVTMKDFVEQPLWELRAICWRCHANRHPHMLEDVA